MNDDKVIYLVDIRDELQSFMHYEEPNEAFDKAWYMWMHYCMRHSMKKSTFFYEALDRGWITRSDAESFCNYIDNRHFWRCIF